MKYCTYMSALDIQSRTEVVVVLSKLPHLGIPEHHLCRAILILSDNPYLARAKGTVLDDKWSRNMTRCNSATQADDHTSRTYHGLLLMVN